MDNVHINGLFPTPVLVVERCEPYTMEEFSFVKNLPLKDGTSLSITSNVLDHVQMKRLKDFFTKYLNIFTEQVYLASSDELDIGISWVNVIKPGKSHGLHKHKNSILSGIYYFESTQDCPLVLNSPLETYNNYEFSSRTGDNYFNSAEWKFPIEGNSLIMFPSWLQHKVNVNNTNSTRYSLAWNAWFKKNKEYGISDIKTYIKT